MKKLNKYKSLFESDDLVIPDIPNTMNFWHGGNLDNYDDIIAQKGGRYEYGAGLYLITHYVTAKKYAKGSRKLYLVTVKKGKQIKDVLLHIDKVNEFILDYVIGSKKKEIKNRMEKFIKNNKIKAEIFNNIILNEKGVKNINSKYLREFLVKNGIDYELVNNPFGWGETMMVLYNMKKIVKFTVVKSTDNITQYDL